MFLQLHIDQVGPARYRAVVTADGREVAPGATVHSSIAQAIQQTAQSVPAGFAHFIEPTFGAVSAGTMLISEAGLTESAIAAAERIAAIVRQVRELGLD